MPTRQEISQRKSAMIDDLRRVHREGRVRAGDVAVSQRELAARYGLSTGLVAGAMRTLEDEGVLYSVPRVGTFVGQRRNDEFEFYLLVLPRAIGQNSSRPDFYSTLQLGFDERIAQLGGTCLTMTRAAVTGARERGELPPLAGVFNFGQRPKDWSWGRTDGVPQVCFEDMIEAHGQPDVVGMDNEGGGRLAVNHLVRAGHERIAFLAAHNDESADKLPWSARREAGWRAALREAGIRADGLALTPDAGQTARIVAHYSHQAVVAQEIAAAHLGPRGLEADGDPITAVVAFNDIAALSVLAALRAAPVPHDCWPAIVGFDNHPCASGHFLSSLRLPWEEVGRHAAELLWARKHGELSGAPVHRSTSMRLIPRLTCRQAWSQQAAHAALAA